MILLTQGANSKTVVLMKSPAQPPRGGSLTLKWPA